MKSAEKKKLRQAAHHLSPVVTIGERGLTDAVAAETDRALTDHELIKVRISTNDRAQRAEMGAELAARTAAEVVQRIGKVLVLYRENPEG